MRRDGVATVTPSEVSRLFAALPVAIRPIVEATLLTGMRLGEVVELRRDSVDLQKAQTTLRRTKNNKVRYLPINDALARVLEQAIAGRGQ